MGRVARAAAQSAEQNLVGEGPGTVVPGGQTRLAQVGRYHMDGPRSCQQRQFLEHLLDGLGASYSKTLSVIDTQIQ